MKRTATAAALLAGLASISLASQPTIQWLPPGFLLTSLSQDGSIGCGNVQGDSSYETFRWVAADNSVTRLGRSTVDTIGVGGGSPDVSWDGNSISATILSSDNLATMGVWSVASGWTEAIPPLPPGAASEDQNYASAWGLSGNGAVICGLNYGGTPVHALGCTWSSSGGLVNYPQTSGKNVRLNAANYDGSIVTGWEDTNGPWWPMVWRNGVRIPLVPAGDVGGGGQGFGINGNGDIIVGEAWDPSVITRVATIWTWNGAAYDINHVGYLPGTIFNKGQAYFDQVSNDGRIAVGSNIYTLNPGGTRDGIVWTQAGGLVKAADYITSLGLAIPADVVQIPELDAISPDGTTIAGIAMTSDVGYQSFVIRIPPACPADVNADGHVNTIDLGALLSHFGQSVPAGSGGDVNTDGVVNTLDLGAMLAVFGSSCP